MKREPPKDVANETITCHACLALNSQAVAFCHQCGSPVSTASTLDPLQSIQAEGFLLRKATEGRPRLIVLLGIWIVFLPWFVISAGLAVHLILNKRGLDSFIFFWGAVGLAYIGFMILYRTTKNYLTLPKEIP